MTPRLVVFSESGIKLISTSEGIDNTPAGMMMHGILATMAEFYSQNLAREALKGMAQKVKKGGTVGKAPLGYKNVRYVDSNGREVRTVELDDERAPFVTEAFRLYSTGKWSIHNLAIELADRGFTTSPTPRKPSKPISEKSLNPLLQNPYYLGKVKFQGVLHDDKHAKLTDEITFRKVQEVMKNHQNGERKRINDHYLKSTVYCGECGSRLIINASKSRSGTYYLYFVCIGRQSKRTSCQQKAILTYEIEDQITEYYKQIEFTEEYCEQLRKQMVADIAKQKALSTKNRDELRRERDRLKDKQRKLLEAYYDNVVNKDLLREEQENITKQQTNIDAQLAIAEDEYDIVEQQLMATLKLIGNCHKAYQSAPPNIRRAFNQAFFEKIYVSPNKADSTKVIISADLAEPFHSTVKNHHLLKSNGWSQDGLVGAAGLEPAANRL